MILHVLDFDRGDTQQKISALSTGLTVTTPTGHVKLFRDRHFRQIEQADVVVVKAPRLSVVTCVQFANLTHAWPDLPLIYVTRLHDDQEWLFPTCLAHSESVLSNGLHLMEAIHDTISHHTSP